MGICWIVILFGGRKWIVFFANLEADNYEEQCIKLSDVEREGGGLLSLAWG